MSFLTYLSSKKIYSPWQFALWRIAFGIFLVFYFLCLVPYASELYSDEGIFPDPTINWTYGYFPNLLNYLDSSFFVEWFVLGLAGLSLCIALGVFRRASAILVWYGMACLINRNVLTIDPALALTGWLLFALALIPRGEPLVLGKRTREVWYMPSFIYWGAWVTLGLSYTVSGVDKFMAPSWQNGSAFGYLLEMGIARKIWLNTAIHSSAVLTVGATWISGTAYILALPLVLIRQTRLFIWLTLTGMFIFVLLAFDLVQVALAILLFHAFLIDSTWFTARDGKRRLVLYDDSCGLCSRFVSFIAGEDVQHRYQFAGFSTQTAEKMLSAEERSRMEEMVFVEGEKEYRGFDAGIRMLESLGGIWRVAGLGRLIPHRVRKVGYKLLARNRHRLGLKTCALPSDERFLP